MEWLNKDLSSNGKR